MAKRHHIWPLAILTLTSCSFSSADESAPRPNDSVEVAAAPQLTEMIVLRALGGLQQGDTVSVDLSSISDENRLSYYRGNRYSGSIDAAALGPADEGLMIVAADRLNVRRCRSTGCSIEGYVSRGQLVEVRDFAGRWYRVSVDGEEVGYVIGEHLELPLLRKKQLYEGILTRTADYYVKELAGIRTDGGGAVFSGHRVSLEGDMLTFAFYTPVSDGPGLQAVCAAMPGIARFVEAAMGASTAQFFPAYSVGVYPEGVGASRTEEMVAGLAGDGGVYCKSG